MYSVKFNTGKENLNLFRSENRDAIVLYLKTRIDRADFKLWRGTIRVFHGRKRVTKTEVRRWCGWKLNQRYDHNGNPT